VRLGSVRLGSGRLDAEQPGSLPLGLTMVRRAHGDGLPRGRTGTDHADLERTI
jgi:hypothetical protein